MKYFYIFQNIDWDLILNKFFLFSFFYILMIYCKFAFIHQLVQFETFEKSKTTNRFLFFILSFTYTAFCLLIIPFVVLFINSFENPNLVMSNYAFTSSLIICLYCLIKSFLYTYIEGGEFTFMKDLINELKQKLNKKPNG